jgi:hypothetical protein
MVVGAEMLKTGLVFVLLLFVASSIENCSAADADDPLVVSLVCSNGRVFRTSGEIMFRVSVDDKHNAELKLTSSVVVVTDSNGEVIFYDNRKNDRNRISFSNVVYILPDGYKDGEYRAVWTVNGISSNVARFQINSSGNLQSIPAFFIEKSERKTGSNQSEVICAYFRNDGADVLSSFDLHISSILLVDGKPHKQRAIMFIMGGGNPSLSPGKTWGFCWELSDFSDVKPGEHKVQLVMGKFRSNAIKIAWPAK